ncbi:SirB2 family protein [Alteromonas facilis]|uniref:SirB2 family protein n=1 Tax=Alteromonas facilis TaxID=2048004 RepID=UPI000C287663|nr:SirB2 family protein [Alteromonas facilis]
MYMMMKHLHLTAIALSVLFFVFRFVLKQMDAAMLQQKWLKIVPHIVDTVLLVSAITLCVLLSQYPIVNGWLTVKLGGLIAYVVFVFLALKRAQSKAGQWGSAVAALICLAVTAKVAILKQPLFF